MGKLAGGGQTGNYALANGCLRLQKVN